MTTLSPKPIRTQTIEAVTGVQLAQGIGVAEVKGFWADAWSQVLKRPAAVLALCWLGVVMFFAVFAPFIASGHPLWLGSVDQRTADQVADSFLRRFSGRTTVAAAEVRDALRDELARESPAVGSGSFLQALGNADAYSGAQLKAIADGLRAERSLDATGGIASVTSPLLKNLTAVDITLAIAAILAIPYVYLAPERQRARRLGVVLGALVCAGIGLIVISLAKNLVNAGEVSGWVRSVRGRPVFPYALSAAIALVLAGVLMLLPVYHTAARRAAIIGAAMVLAVVASGLSWSRPLQIFQYQDQEVGGSARAIYTIVPFSPEQRYSELNRVPPGSMLGEGLGLPPNSAPYHRRFLLGSDAFGQDVLSQLLHACRLAISIGLVSTGIAVLIGVTVGGLAGYFGGPIDLLLQRIIEIFMAVPVLFLLIVAAGVLPDQLRNTYVTMAIIGAVTWTSAARYTRAEFYKLRGQDFVQSAKAVGLPLRAILFKHMLPNGVTPVLVDASFLIAGAVIAEATLSFLGLGPVDQASWGKLLSSAMSSEGEFKWWLAIFPGLAIFLTVLSYNLIGEALRDAIDPKLKKARV